MVMAHCPCCGLHLVMRRDGTFPRHRATGPGTGTGRVYCEGSYWLVEATEVEGALA